jgi:hypothetical protein
MEDQGRGLQPQSRRHRPLHPEIMGRRRSHGPGKKSRLLEQGPSLSRPHRAETAARCAIALCVLAVGRSRYRLGRRIRCGQYPEGAKGSEAEGAHLFGFGCPGLCLQHQGRAVRRRARAPGDGDGTRPQEVFAGDHQRPGASRQQSLRRRPCSRITASRSISRRSPPRRRAAAPSARYCSNSGSGSAPTWRWIRSIRPPSCHARSCASSS